MTWLLHTDAGLLTRIVVGVVIFTLLAVVDLLRHGRLATRWREYVFLLAVLLVVLLYGVVNDQITSRISWEYFYYGKGLSDVLPDTLPPDTARLSFEAAKVGLKATWSPGLLIGVALLLANNPSRLFPRLTYRQLLARIPFILCITLITACLGALLGYLGFFIHFSRDFQQMLAHDEFRPRRFMAVFGIHLGGYVGAALGTVAAVAAIFRQRRLSG